VRSVLLAAVAVVLGAVALVVVGTNASAPEPTCADEMDPVACTSAVGAVVRRGLPELHPLILATRVEPGAQPGPQENGHRATVEFDMLGVPGPVVIELYYDVGAHWGGRLDRSEAEVAAWALAPLALAGLVAVPLVGLGWRRRRSMAPGDDPSADGATG
jgi:hypothetical protein